MTRDQGFNIKSCKIKIKSETEDLEAGFRGDSKTKKIKEKQKKNNKYFLKTLGNRGYFGIGFWRGAVRDGVTRLPESGS